MITLSNITKSYGQNLVLNKINMKFDEGKVYGLVGKNGAGKSTLFRCIAGLETSLGTIKSPFEELKRHLGFLETNPHFMSKITGWEYLKLLCLSRGIKAENFEDQNVFDLPLGQYAETYSTGMKKKLALLGVLLQKNEVYILDEPFNGVDIQSSMLISEIIQRLKSKGKLVLISSHNFSSLQENCDSISILENGQIDRTVYREEYAELEREMRDYFVGSRLDNLEI